MHWATLVLIVPLVADDLSLSCSHLSCCHCRAQWGHNYRHKYEDSESPFSIPSGTQLGHTLHIECLISTSPSDSTDSRC